MPDQKYELQYVIKGDASGLRPANRELEKFDKNADKVAGGKFLSGLSGIATGSQLNGLTSQITSASDALSAIPGPAGAAAAGIALVATASVGAGVALFNLTKESADYGSEIYNASVKTGLSAETISALKLAADRTGVSLESVGTIIGRFSRLVGEAAQGSEQANETLTRLGIEPKKAINDLDGALASVFKRIADMPSPIARATAAQQAFGKAGTELLKVLDETKGDLPGLIAEAKRLGVVLTDEDAAAADEFGDQIDLLNAQFRGLKFALARELMPVFSDTAKRISEWLAENKGEVRQWSLAMAAGARGAIGAINAVADAARSAHKVLQEFWAVGGIVMGSVADLDSRVAASLPAEKKRRPFSGDDEYLDNLKAKKDAADKARKEALDRAKRDNAAMIAIEQTYIKDIEAMYAGALSGAAQEYKAGGASADYKARVNEAIDFYKTAVKKSFENIARLENVAAERDQKTAKEKELLEKQQAERLSEMRLKTSRDELEAQDAIKAEQYERDQKSLSRATALWGAYYDLREAQLASLGLKEVDYIRSHEALALQAIESDIDLYTNFLLNAQLSAEQRADIGAKLLLLEKQYGVQRIKGAKAVGDAEQKEAKATADAYKELADAMEEFVREQEEAIARRKLETTVGSSTAISAMDELRQHFVSDQNTAAIAGVDALTTAFEGLGQAIGSAVEAWVLYGNAGASVQQITAQILSSIAQQAAVKAIYELAEGFAMLALALFGAGTGPSAAAHFQAAAIYGSVAGVAAIAGRQVAGDSFKDKGAGGSGSGSSANGAGGQSSSPSAYTRRSNDYAMSGQRPEIQALADEVRSLHEKIGSMRPGDVLTTGIRQKPGLILKTAADDSARDYTSTKTLLKRGNIK